MAKDPAFLFYPNDWIGGTMGMTFEEKGAYMELLMYQFNVGHMEGHMVGRIVGQLWDNIKHKFKQDDNGFWYNDRLEVEKEKRKSFTMSRKNNLSGKNQYTKKQGHTGGHMSNHMENENENENKDVNNNNKAQKIKKNNYPTLQEVREYFKENGYSNGDKAFQYYDTAGWRDSKGKQVKNWKQKMISVWFKDEYKIKQIETIDKYANTRNDLK